MEESLNQDNKKVDFMQYAGMNVMPQFKCLKCGRKQEYKGNKILCDFCGEKLKAKISGEDLDMDREEKEHKFDLVE